MRFYRTIKLSGVGDFIASVSGSSGDYDITLDNGFVLEEYDETAGVFDQEAPVAGDLLVFGALTGSRTPTVANAQVIKAAVAADFFTPEDNS
jgi:hypothetical protein